MKKGFFAFLAILTVFAMVMTGCDTGSSPKAAASDDITISFDLNGNTAAATVQSITAKKGVAVGTLPNGPAATRVGNEIWTFKGWFEAATGGTAVTATKTFDKDTKLFAQYNKEAAPAAGKVRVYYNFNWPATSGTSPAAVYVDVNENTAIGTLNVPTQAQTPQYGALEGWYDNAAGTGTKVTETKNVGASTANGGILNLYAKWTITPPQKVTITFNINQPTGYAGATITQPQPKDLDKDTEAIGNLPVLTADGYIFNGWFSAATAGTAITAASTFTSSTSIYAQWEAVIVGGVTITFDVNYATADPKTFTRQAPSGGAVTSWPTDPVRTGYWAFNGWFQYDTGAGEKYTATSTWSADATIYAGWKDTTPEVEDPNLEKKGAERVVVTNGNHVMYRFTIPKGKTWADYVSLTADYMIPLQASMDAENSARNVNLMGAYNLPALTPPEYALVDNGEKYFAAYGMGASNTEYRYDVVANWSTITAVSAGKGLNEDGELDGSNPKKGDWFRITYQTDGARAAAPAANTPHQPDAADTGTFYFGVGISSGAGPFVQYIRNVRLRGDKEAVGYDPDVDDVVGVPLWYEVDGQLYMATAGYQGVVESQQLILTEREMVDGSQPDPIVLKGSAASYKLGYTYKGDLLWDPDNPLSGGGTPVLDPTGLILGLPAGSFARIYCYNTTNPYDSRNGWGIGDFGASGNITGKAGRDFYTDVILSGVNYKAGSPGVITINIYNACTLYGVEIFAKNPDLEWEDPITMKFGDEEDVDGKGTNFARPISASDVATILAAKDGSFLRITFDTTDYHPDQTNIVNWGIGNVNGQLGGDSIIGAKGRGPLSYDVDLWAILRLAGALDNGIPSQIIPDLVPTELFVNYWDGTFVADEFEFFAIK